MPRSLAGTSSFHFIDDQAATLLVRLPGPFSWSSLQRHAPRKFARLTTLHILLACSPLLDLESRKCMKLQWQKWQEICGFIFPQIRTSGFDLELICVVTTCSVKTADEILGPLRSLRGLKSCKIRIVHDHSDSALELVIPRCESLSQTVALQAQAKRQEKDTPRLEESFRLLDLPQELWSQVLTHTDLVTDPDKTRLQLNKTCRTRCGADLYRQGEFSMFCRRASGFQSKLCDCWKLPIELFLVCRQVKEEAERVFFSRNRFAVWTGAWRLAWRPQDEALRRLKTSHFIREMERRNVLSYLRCVDLYAPSLQTRRADNRRSAHVFDWLWQNLVSAMTTTGQGLQGQTRPTMTLRIHLANTASELSKWQKDRPDERDVSLDAIEYVAETIAPFAGPGDLLIRRCFIYTACGKEVQYRRSSEEEGIGTLQ